jgi:tetratricopeptide (TPR) repeat protein
MTEESLFQEALSRPPEERAAFLDAACADRPQLRASVEALLAAYEKSGHVLDRPPEVPSPTVDPDPSQAPGAVDGAFSADPDAAPFEQAPTSDLPPGREASSVIAGRYTLVEKIGEGGMGEVWVARQTEPVKRKVALKLIKAGMDSKAVLARFEQERQALALMDHPHIARVLDGGLTPDRRPFFVMELVNGLPLTKFCDEARLGIRERLELFAAVCQAVQHAHQKGVIHRDLKPSNILVTLIDGRPVPKVIDFGVAKATAGKLTDESLSTHFGAVVGTLEYMAPEQAGLAGADIDTRADIYSLGVILYELLTGLRPLDAKRLKKAAFAEMLRVLKEEEPSKPSTRLSTDESAPSLAALRQTEPKKLASLLRGELDWVVMKCLEKRRDHRYETANGLARDVQRYLAHEVVEARPPSAGYRLGKFLRRNKGPVVAAGLALLVGMAGTTWGMIQADRQRAAADEARAAEAAQRVRAENARDRTREALDAMTSSVTGDSLTTQKEISEEQKRFLREVLTYYQEFAGDKADDETSRARTAQAAGRVGLIESRLGRRAEAAAAFRLANDGYAKLAADFPAVAKYRQNLAMSHHHLGVVLGGLGQRPEAERQYRQALALYEKLAADAPAVPDYRQHLAKGHNSLGALLKDLGQRAEAEQHYRQALALSEKLVADAPVVPDYRQELAESHNNLGNLLENLEKRPEAEQHYRQALAHYEKLAADFPAVPEYRTGLAGIHHNLRMVLPGLGKRPEAEEQYRKALALRAKLVADFPVVPEYRKNLASSHNNLGTLLESLKQFPEAERQHRQALALYEKLAADFPAVPEYRQVLAVSHNNLGIVLDGLGQRPEAERQHRQALALREKLAADFPVVPKYQIDLGGTCCNLGNLVREGGRPGDSLEWYDKAIRTLTAVYDQDRRLAEAKWFLWNSYWNRAMAYDRLKKYAEAIQDWDRAVELSPETERPSPRPKLRADLANSHNGLGLLLEGQGKGPEAERHHRQALALREQLAADFPAVPEHQINLGGSYCNLGNFSRKGGRSGDSLEWYDKAIRTLTAVYKQDPRSAVAKEFLHKSHWGRALANRLLQKYAAEA